MGVGKWSKALLLSRKKGRENRSKLPKLQVHSTSEELNGCKWWKHGTRKGSTRSITGNSNGNEVNLRKKVEDRAATRIQNAFRTYMARKTFHSLRGSVKFQVSIKDHTVRKQVSAALDHLHTWSRIQAQIRDRRHYMVTEGRLKQKKLENQLKLEAKLQELEVEWCGGSETMEEILSRIQQREEAAVKRERTLAYAFSHQWRANASQYLGHPCCVAGNLNWGWSWMDRWIAARPWETRVHALQNNPKKVQAKLVSSVPVKPPLSNTKGTIKQQKTAPQPTL